MKDILNSHGNYGLRMPMNTQVAFEHFTLTNHQDIKISIRKGGILLVEGEGMSQNLSKRETSYPSLVSNHRREWHQSFQNHRYKQQSSGLRSYRPHPAANTKNGYYYVDVYAHGMIPTYSLFTGNSDWNHEGSLEPSPHLPSPQRLD